MAGPQSGVFDLSHKHITLLALEVPEAGLSAGSVSKAAAVIPALTAGLGKDRPEWNPVSFVAFRPLFWSFAWQGGQPSGLHPARKLFGAVEAAELEGDMLICLASESPECNDALEQLVLEKLGRAVDLLENFKFPPSPDARSLSEPTRNTLIGKDDPEFENGALAVTRHFFRPGAASSTPVFSNPEQLGEGYCFSCENDEDCFQIVMSKDAVSFSGLADPEDVEGVEIKSKGYYFIPSLDVLLGLRLGGIRMGTLSPTHPYKDPA